MTNKKWLIIGIGVLLVLGVSGFLTHVIAKQEGIEEKGSFTVVTKDQNKSVFLGNGMVEVRKDIRGDLFVMGGSIVIQGDVTENLLVMGGTVKITGDVRESVLAFGGNIEINGRVGQDVLAAGGSVKIEGDIGDDVRVSGREIEIVESRIGGDLFAFGEKVTLDNETVVHGEKKITQPTEQERRQRTMESIVKWFINTFFAIIGWTLLALTVLKLAPVKMQNLFKCASSIKEAILSLVVGFFAFPVTAFALLLLFISRIGVPLAFFTISIGIAVLLVAWVFPVSSLTYQLLPEKRKGYLLAVIISMPVAVVVCRLPIIGWLIWLLLVIWGVGAIILAKFRLLTKNRAILKVEKEKK